MRKLACFLFMSVDGVIESPDRFVHESLFEDIVSVIATAIADQDTVLLGRKLYEEWADYWPSSDIEPFNHFINTVEKIIVSRSLTSVSWNNASLMQGDLADAVTALKAGDGKTICAHGSVELIQSLLKLGLVDELRLAQFPVVAGHGRRLLEGHDTALHLKLTHSHATPLGIQYQVYSV